MKAITEGENRIYDVIISGAGPVGLFLACELALADISVLILEKARQANSALKQLPFGVRGLSSTTIEAFDRRGLFDQLEIHKRHRNPHASPASEIQTPAQRQVGHFAGIPLLEDNIDTSQWVYRLPGFRPTALMSELREIESILSGRAEDLGVITRLDCPVTDVIQTEEQVKVISGKQSFNGKWLVGCDGSRSVVRKALGFEFAGTEPEFTGYSAQIDLKDPQKLKPGRNLTAKGMYLQSQPGYILIQDFDGGAGHSTAEPLTLDRLQEVLRRVSETDATIEKMHTVTTWTDRSRQATTYQKGRVLLAGDAAHIHSPLGGQGLNLGIGDAMNLGWKLAATIKGRAPENLLDSYFEERYPVGAQVLDWSRAQVSIMKPEAGARAMNAVFRDMMNTRDGGTYIAGRVWGIFTRYDLGNDHPLVGHSVPDFEFEDGSRVGALMHQGIAVMLDFEGNEDLKNAVESYSNQLIYLKCKPKNSLDLDAVLVRPDGIVAWASGIDITANDLNNALRRWFVSDMGRPETPNK